MSRQDEPSTDDESVGECDDCDGKLYEYRTGHAYCDDCGARYSEGLLTRLGGLLR